MEVSLKSETVLVHALIQFCSHRAQIHRIFDDIEVANQVQVRYQM